MVNENPGSSVLYWSITASLLALVLILVGMHQNLSCRKVLSFNLNFPSRLIINYYCQCLTIRENRSTSSLYWVFHRQDISGCLWKVWPFGLEPMNQESMAGPLRLGFFFFFLFLACTSFSYLPHSPSEPTCVQSSPEFFCFTYKDLRLRSKSESRALGTGTCSPVRQQCSHTGDRAS